MEIDMKAHRNRAVGRSASLGDLLFGIIYNLKRTHGIKLLQVVNGVVGSVNFVTAFVSDNDALLMRVGVGAKRRSNSKCGSSNHDIRLWMLGQSLGNVSEAVENAMAPAGRNSAARKKGIHARIS